MERARDGSELGHRRPGLSVAERPSLRMVIPRQDVRLTKDPETSLD